RIPRSRVGFPGDNCQFHYPKEGRMDGQCNGLHSTLSQNGHDGNGANANANANGANANGANANGVSPHLAALTTHKPYDLSGAATYDLVSRPSKVFYDELGPPVSPEATLEEWLGSLPRQLAANDLRRVTEHLARAYKDGRTIGAALGGHVIKTG